MTRSQRIYGHVAILILCFTTAWASKGRMVSAQSEKLPDNWAVYMCNSIGGRLLELRRYGDERGRNSEVAIIELTSPDARLRVLHHTRTLCPFGLLVTANSRCGRFLITMDEWLGAGTTERDLVIYDLVRNEHSAYSIRDFLSEETVDSLTRNPRSAGPAPGVVWCRNGGFDYRRMEFYPTIPRECRRLDLPFVVVDLLTREAREEPIPDREIDRHWSEPAYFPNGRWLCSMGDEPLPAADEPLRLPMFLRVEYGEEGERQRRVFRLDQETGDYRVVTEQDWPDERLPLITAGMYRKAESERGVQRRE